MTTTWKRFPSVGRRATESHVEAYRSSGGRSSGESRPVMLMHVTRGDDLIVVGSAGGSATTPNRYKNLMAAGGAVVQVGGDRWSVAARELADGAERDECWALATASLLPAGLPPIQADPPVHTWHADLHSSPTPPSAAGRSPTGSE